MIEGLWPSSSACSRWAKREPRRLSSSRPTTSEDGNFARQADVLEVMIATAASKGDRVRLYGRLADVHEKLDDQTRAFDVILRAADAVPDR